MMQKFLYLEMNGADIAPVLIGIDDIACIKRESDTVVAIFYATQGARDRILITASVTDSGSTNLNWIVAQIRNVLSMGYTKAAPLLTPPIAIDTVTID